MLKVIMFTLFSFITINAQEIKKDSIPKNSILKPNKFHYKKLIIPSLLIGYGVIGIESDQLKSFNTGIRDEVKEDIDQKITIDDFSQYAPLLSVYALNFSGVKGKKQL